MFITGTWIVALVFLLVTKSYRAWKRYYPTVLYFSGFSLLYPLICNGYLMWDYPSRLWLDDKIVHLINASILFPCTALVYLTHMPRKRTQKALYYVGWVLLYSLMEWMWRNNGEIAYGHGWGLTYSILFDVIMFFMFALHDKRPEIALPISYGFLAAFIFWFRVPM